MSATSFAPSRVRLGDIPGLVLVGPRTRRLRTALTALGVAIGIAALVAVMGISESSRADLLAQLDALGTNRLQVAPGTPLAGGEEVTLPETAGDQIRRLDTVEQAAAVSAVDATVRRSDVIPDSTTEGISVRAADRGLLDAVGGTVAAGRWHDAASERLPTVVLGAVAAGRLGIHTVDGREVVIGDQRFTVVGILDPVPLYETLDAAAFVGYPIADELFDTTRAPTSIYVVADPDAVDEVADLLPATTNPQSPAEVEVTNPSDALAAREAVDETLTNLLLGLGGVALLVGGIGIANVMVIGVLERRTEIGVRRALGATKGHVRLQFLLEATLLGVLGGIAGVVLGVAVTTGYTAAQDQTLAIPPSGVVGGLTAAVAIGAIAGLSPAARAARLAPAESIRPA
jgi:putative ABC transport system permease protein